MAKEAAGKKKFLLARPLLLSSHRALGKNVLLHAVLRTSSASLFCLGAHMLLSICSQSEILLPLFKARPNFNGASEAQHRYEWAWPMSSLWEGRTSEKSKVWAFLLTWKPLEPGNGVHQSVVTIATSPHLYEPSWHHGPGCQRWGVKWGMHKVSFSPWPPKPPRDSPQTRAKQLRGVRKEGGKEMPVDWALDLTTPNAP